MIDTLEIWHTLVRSRDMQALHDLLADEVVFHSPVVHTPQRGKAITALYLTGAMHVLNNEHFRYEREVVGARDAVLEFARCCSDWARPAKELPPDRTRVAGIGAAAAQRQQWHQRADSRRPRMRRGDAGYSHGVARSADDRSQRGTACTTCGVRCGVFGGRSTKYEDATST